MAGVVACWTAAACSASTSGLDLGTLLQPITVSPSDGLLGADDVDMFGTALTAPPTAEVATFVAAGASAPERGPCGTRLVGVSAWPDEADEVRRVLTGGGLRLSQAVGRAGAVSDAYQRAIAADLRLGCPAFEMTGDDGRPVRVDRVTPVSRLPRGTTAWTSRVTDPDGSTWTGTAWLRVGELYTTIEVRSAERLEPARLRALIDVAATALRDAQRPTESAAP